ncbi:MAG TPA: cell envelope integrity protein CreD [Chitinophagaceae bacterium]|nr:cell envelope integrity protein CreD [Chitinophagaceae bacterium]
METVATNVWQKSKLLIKGLLIGSLVLLLLIPAYFVQNVITEREARQKEAFTEVSSKWAGRQNITGPVLVLPYNETITGDKGQVVILKKLAYILPDNLIVESIVKPEERHRGIFQVMLYSSEIKMSGKFNSIPLQQLKIDSSTVLWNEAYVCMELADSKGLKEEIKLVWNDTTVTLNPSAVNNGVMKEGFMAPVTVSPDKEVQFSSAVLINGSEQLLFTPVGKETTVKLNSTWPDPSFTGGQLPDHRISDSGFVATWKSLAHTRNFPQAWKENTYKLQSASFGADLFIPVNGYQKTMRSVKYAILCILLTFAAFFIIETVNKKSVHPFQYALIGLALILFYTLLLSISEYTGFNTAYIIASAATVGLIAWFVKGILQSSKLTTVLGVVLVLMYSYIFTILQLQDYSLLLGSIGLFLTLAVIMHFSKKIQW